MFDLWKSFSRGVCSCFVIVLFKQGHGQTRCDGAERPANRVEGQQLKCAAQVDGAADVLRFCVAFGQEAFPVKLAVAGSGVDEVTFENLGPFVVMTKVIPDEDITVVDEEEETSEEATEAETSEAATEEATEEETSAAAKESK